MFTSELDQLRCPDIASLRLALVQLCGRYGSIAQLSVLPAGHTGKLQALCFLRMSTPEEERRLMSGLGIGRFGGELVIVADLYPPGQSLTADLFESSV